MFNPDCTHRYALWRQWVEGGPRLMVIGLNPSTADETLDDPTVRRCIGYAKRWGFNGLEMRNLFSYRSTDPAGLRGHTSMFLDDQQRNLAFWSAAVPNLLNDGGAILAAWGNGGHGHTDSLLHLCRISGTALACLGTTKLGEPIHPLYQPLDARPVPFLSDGGLLCTGPLPTDLLTPG